MSVSLQDEWKIKIVPPAKRDQYRGKKIRLSFYIPHGRYLIKEQYYLHDGNSFIAEAGGYLGLLLGHSALGLVYMLVGQWSAMKKAAVGKQDE